MKAKYFWPLAASLMIVATELFGMLPADAAPPAKPKQPVVRLGQPYRAELRRKRPTPAPAFLYYHGIYLSWRDSVRFDALRKIKHP